VIPQCASDPRTGREGCHDRLGRIGPKTFERETGCDLAALADQYAAEWRRLSR
jgi:hypothetical protein